MEGENELPEEVARNFRAAVDFSAEHLRGRRKIQSRQLVVVIAVDEYFVANIVRRVDESEKKNIFE